MCFPVSYAGFFAKSHSMFFLLSSFRFCPPLKNDGTSELRLNTCPSFLNEVKNLAKNTGVKYVFCGYPMPDSSLRVKLCFFLLSSFRFCPPLKNDGTSELRFEVGLNILSCLRKHAPIASQSSALPSEFGGS